MPNIAYQIKSQFTISRNLKEGIVIKLQRTFWASIYLIKALWSGLLFMKKQQIGSSVIYKGKKWVVTNWSSQPYVNLSRKNEYAENVPQEEITDIRNIREFKRRFMSGFNFYLNNWYQIDVQNRLY